MECLDVAWSGCIIGLFFPVSVDPTRHENEARWDGMKKELLAAIKTALEALGEDGVEQDELIALTDDVPR